MEIITKYGSIDYDDLDEFDLSKETLEFLERQKNAADVFFATEIDLTDMDSEFDEQIQDLAEVAIAENKFSEPAKAFALAENLGEELSDIEEDRYRSTNFHTSGAEYMVLDEDEADEAALESAIDMIRDIGIDGFSDGFKDYIYSNFVKTEWFDEAMDEYNRSYADDIKNDTSSNDDVYVNRLHEEMVENSIMDEPEWPGERDEFEFEREDYERQEFTDEEPDPDDYSEEDHENGTYDEAAQAWADSEVDWENEQDRLEAEWEAEQDRLEKENDEKMEAAADDYRTDLESEVEDKIDEFVEHLNNQYNNGLDYWEQHFGADDIARVASENGLIDENAVAEWLVEEDGRGQLLSGYDGGEDSESITYRGNKYEFYIYRVS